jgi:polyhydroxyalkanoate synthesis regulator phasin
MALAGVVVALAVGSSGCVNFEKNATHFCDRNQQLLDTSLDGEVLTKDQAVYYSDTLEKSMKYAEDATQVVRRTARRLADSYADVRKIAGDDKISQSEIEETYGKLDVHREEMRDVCSPIISQASKG